MNHFRMIWEFSAAENGNIALTGEIDLQGGDEFTIAVSLSGSYQSAATNVLQSLATPFDLQHETYVQQWQAAASLSSDFSDQTSDNGGIYRLSRCVLLAHEDKDFQGGLVASMSIPCGETNAHNEIAGDHPPSTPHLAPH